MDARTLIDQQISAQERLREADRALLRGISLENRSDLIKSACRAAQAIHESRVASGLPPVEPTPWPESTWELFRKHAPNGRTNAGK